MRQNKTIITVDYETWQPIPAGKSIDWEADILIPAGKLMDACETSGAKITFMVEMCEIFWLERNEPDIYMRIVKQIQDMVRRGHDVQLHMHPNWFPELGARKTENGFEWNWEYIHCDAVPGDLSELVRRCKERLEEIVRVVRPDYKVCAFRAGGYRVQPFARIYEALKDNNILIETSVYAGGISGDREYDFSKCNSLNNPYIASAADPCISSEEGICELPIACYRSGARVFIDDEESRHVAKRLFSMPVECFSQNENFFTLIGHTKAEHDYSALSEELVIWGGIPGTEYVTLSESADCIINHAQNQIMQNQSLEEVGEIINDLYKEIAPGNPDNVTWCGELLLSKKALCAGYVWIAMTILHMYGYYVRQITAFVEDMPNGRGDHKSDTHELIHLVLHGKHYLVCPMSNRMLLGSIHEFIRNPKKADENYRGDQRPDARFQERDYENYITSFLFSRLVHYTEGGVIEVPIPISDGRKRIIMRKLRNLIRVYLPKMIRHYR